MPSAKKLSYTSIKQAVNKTNYTYRKNLYLIRDTSSMLWAIILHSTLFFHIEQKTRKYVISRINTS